MRKAIFIRVVNFRFSSCLFALILVSLITSSCNNFSPKPTSVGSSTNPNAPGRNSGINSANTIRLTNGEWNPYTGIDLPGYGCDSKVVSEVFSQMGYSVEFGFFPWARAYHLAAIGEYDGAVEWDDTPEHRTPFYISSEALSEQEWVFYFRIDKPFLWQSLEDLRGKNVGITSNYAYSDAFSDLIKSGKVSFTEASSDEANFKKLLSGRIDVFPIEKSVGQAILQKSFLPEEQAQLSFDPRSFHKFHPYLLLSKEIPINAGRIGEFNAGLTKLKASPVYDEIMQNCQK